MTEIKETIPNYKIYRDKIMYGVAYLGGPLAAGYIIAENFKAFGDIDKYKKTWVITIVSTIVIFGSVLLIPDSVKIPNYIIPFFYTLIAYWLMRYYQGPQIEKHINEGGKIYSGWRGFWIGLICITITLAVFLPAAYFLMPDDRSEVFYQPYHSITHEITYDPDHIEKNEIKFLGEELAQINYLDSTYKMYLYVDKEGKSIKLSIPFIGPAWDEPNTIAYYKELQRLLKNAYEKKNFIEIAMCDTLLNVKRSFK